MTTDINNFSIVLPAKNESKNLQSLLQRIRDIYPQIEIILVDDGSTDNTADIAKNFNVIVISHPYSLGNGAAIKSGARRCTTRYIVFMDSDGQHPPEDIPKLIEKLNNGYSMVMGARSNESQASFLRLIANTIYNKLASSISNYQVEDLTTGFRVVDRKLFSRFLYLLPNGFSYPTTITMAFLRSGFPISYVPITANKRKGKSNINPFVDGMRFLIIILKVGSLYSPLKFFIPPSFLLFILGIVNYGFTYFTSGTFTNMSALLIISSIVIFLFGLLAEQITVLTYASSQRREDKND